MIIKKNEILVIRKRLVLDDNNQGWTQSDTITTGYPLEPNTEIIFDYFFWNDFNEIGLNFKITNDNYGPEFLSAEFASLVSKGYIDIKN